MDDDSGPTEKYSWDLCISTVAVYPSGPLKQGREIKLVTFHRPTFSWCVLYVVCNGLEDLAVSPQVSAAPRQAGELVSALTDGRTDPLRHR